MKEHHITFKTAKLAKEKEFNEYVRGLYEYSLTEQHDPEGGTSGPFGWEKGEVNFHNDPIKNNYPGLDYSNESWVMYAAPTQSFLQKWLREQHSIHIAILHQNSFYEYVIDSYNYPTVKHYESDDNIVYRSYEDALESALEFALGLVKKGDQ